MAATRLIRLLRRGPTLVRTLRPLRFDQMRAQIQHAVSGLPAPTRLAAADYRLSLEVPCTPFLPPPPHVQSRGAREVALLATPLDLRRAPDWTGTEHGPLFAYHLHQHEYLRTDAFSARERTELLLDWVARHPAGVGWDPHPISLRLLCWGKLLLSPGQLAFGSESERQTLLRSMADQAETLARGLEVRLQANHLFSNLLSVVWAGLLIEPHPAAGAGEDAVSGALTGARPGADTKANTGTGTDTGTAAVARGWLARTPQFLAELSRQILPDGGHEERSPMYHALLLENVLDLLNLVRARSARAPDGLEAALGDAAERMLGALEVLSHPDGRIALFSDAGFDVAAEPAELAAYAARLGLSASREPAAASRVLASTGYVRLVAPEVSLLASVAGPAPAHQPGHAHCDALAFELCLGGHRVVTDTGLYEYRLGQRRDIARATASHSTLQIDGQEQAEVWSAHRVGGRPRVAFEGWDGESVAQAFCAGWSRPKTLHRRTFRVAAAEAEVIDRLEGPAQRIRSVLPIDPRWSVSLDASGHKATGRFCSPATVACPSPPRASPAQLAPAAHAALSERRPAAQFEIELPDALVWRIERGPYFPSFGVEVERDLLVGEGAPFSEAVMRFRWIAS